MSSPRFVDGQCMCVNCRPGFSWEDRYLELWDMHAELEMELYELRVENRELRRAEAVQWRDWATVEQIDEERP